MALPTYLGIGVPRAGTTWLHEVLGSHPDVYVPARRKELSCSLICIIIGVSDGTGSSFPTVPRRTDIAPSGRSRRTTSTV